MNPYREPGDRSCVTDIIEDVLSNDLGKVVQMKPRSKPDFLKSAGALRALNMLIGPRLTVAEIRCDILTDSISVRIGGRGCVSCDLRFSRMDLLRCGNGEGNGSLEHAIFFGLYRAILEKLPP